MKEDVNKINWQEKVKEIGPMKLIALIVVGALLLILSYGDLFEWGKGNNVTDDQSSGLEISRLSSDEQYIEKMEIKVKEILKSMKGVGKVDVIITPAVSKEQKGLLEGILIVCEGGDNTKLVREIISSIQVLFGTPPHKIKIMKMES